MRVTAIRSVIVVGACLMSMACAWGQARAVPQQSKEGTVEVAVSVEAACANTVATYNFWMEGGGAQAAVKISRHWSGVADISYLHTGQMPHTAVGLDLFTAVFGPRYSMTFPDRRVKIFGQAMSGAAHGSNSLFPNPSGATSSASGVALLLGGGIDYRASSRMSFRLLEADWLRTELSNGTTTVQNNLRLGSGLVVHF